MAVQWQAHDALTLSVNRRGTAMDIIHFLRALVLQG